MTNDAALISDLNDLLQLDHDAVEVYTMAIDMSRSEEHRERLVAFRLDHKRHIEQLAGLIRERGATPVEMPHLPTAPFKLAVQAAGAMAGMVAGDAPLLLAFEANERQVRDKYARYAARPYPEEVARVVRQAADDEELHYRWVKQTLQALGYGEETLVGKANRIFGRVHGAAANAVEGIERAVMDAAYRARERGR